MKEQGKDFDPSKETVTKETIKKIVNECHRIFDVNLPFMEWDFPKERHVRVCYTESGGEIAVFRGGRFVIEIIGNQIPGVKPKHYYMDYLLQNTGNNTFSIRLTEDLKSKKLIDWDKNYRENHDFIKEGEKLTYIYVVDSNEKGSNMNIYFTGNTFIANYDKGPRKFSSFQEKRVNDILKGSFSADPEKKYVFTHEVRLNPLANPVIPSDERANNLLEFMKNVTTIKRFSPKPFM